jgi:SAM-dependent methyltransferase
MDSLHAYIASVFITRKFGSALDIGCAHGVLTKFLNGFCPTTGLDIAPGYIRKAKKLFPGIRYIVGDILKHRPRKRYDVAVTHGTLIHIPPKDIKRAITHILKIANCGLFTESSTNPTYEPRRKKEYNARRYWSHRALHPRKGDDLAMQYYYKHDYPALFDELGLKYREVITFDVATKTVMYYVWL